MQPRSTLALPLTIRAWLAKCKLHFAGRLFFRWLTLVTFLLGLVAALALYVSDLGHLRAQVEIRSLLFPNMLSPNILLDHSRSRRKWRDFSGRGCYKDNYALSATLFNNLKKFNAGHA